MEPKVQACILEKSSSRVNLFSVERFRDRPAGVSQSVSVTRRGLFTLRKCNDPCTSRRLKGLHA